MGIVFNQWVEMSKLDKQNCRLKAENEKLKLRLRLFEENVTRIITNFWMWYVSGNHKRDLSAKEEGEKYANNFFHDLIQEVDEEE